IHARREFKKRFVLLGFESNSFCRSTAPVGRARRSATAAVAWYEERRSRSDSPYRGVSFAGGLFSLGLAPPSRLAFSPGALPRSSRAGRDQRIRRDRRTLEQTLPGLSRGSGP